MKEINKIKRKWSKKNGFESWSEFANKTRSLNNTPYYAIVNIPETIINELLEMAVK